MISLILIDCWNTILENSPVWDSLLVQKAYSVFSKHDPSVSYAVWNKAFHQEAFDFSQVLAQEMVTLPIEDRLRNLGRCAGIDIPESVLGELCESFEATILDPLPQLVNGVEGFLDRARSAHRKLCLVCNTGWFSARAIEKVLRQYKLDTFLDSAVYSDQVGVAKPSPRMFDAAKEAFGCSSGDTVHIGDNLMTDVMGALYVGLHAIHFHRHGRCDRRGFWCASNYEEVWDILTSGLGVGE